MKQPFNRSERTWINLTNDHDELRRELIQARGEVVRLTAFLTLLAAPVPFAALSDATLREMGLEFSKRLLLAQDALRGAAVPRPQGFFQGLSKEQQVEALAYDGPESHGDPEFATPLSNGDRA